MKYPTIKKQYKECRNEGKTLQKIEKLQKKDTDLQI